MSNFPRWRLTQPHYLNVLALGDGTKVEWEHKETSRETGRAIRKLYPVPALLNPDDSSDYNYPGEIIVASEVEGAHNAYPRDIIFSGEPTQEMEPLNEEAEAITESLRMKWEHPINSLPANGGMNAQEQAFMENMMASFAKQIGATMQAPNATVPQAQYDELKERLAKLEAMIAAQNKAPATDTARRA
jgi:hypothetical protein